MQKDKLHQFFPDKILDFSSQYGSDKSRSYTFSQLIGKPTIYPKHEDNSEAGAFRYYGMKIKNSPSYLPEVGSRSSKYSSEDFFEFCIKYPLIVSTFEVFETYNPGSVVKIFCLLNNSWVKMWEKDENTEYISQKGVFSPKIKKFNKKSQVFRVEVNQSENTNYSQYDTVCVTGYRYVFNYSDYEIEDFYSLKSSKSHYIDNKICDTTDYISQLPEEILILIFSFLPMGTLARMSLVSKRFQSTSMTVLADTKELNLKSFWNRIDHNSLLWLSRHCPNVHRVDLSWVGKHQNFTLTSICHFFALSCSNLTTLRLCACRFVNDLVLRCITNNCKSLRELDLSSCTYVTSNGFKVLKDLPIHFISLYRTLINCETIISLLICWPNLYHLNLGSCSQLTDWANITLNIRQNCKQLRSLDVWRSGIDNDGLYNLIATCTKIEELDLGWCISIVSQGHAIVETNWNNLTDDDLNYNQDVLVSMARKLPNLRKLHVTGNRSVSDNDIRALIKFCPNMQYLDIMGACSVTPKYVSRLLESMEQLKMLDLSYCRHIRRIDFVSWRNKFKNCIILQSYQDVMSS